MRVLVAYVTAGAGHRRSAEAIAHAWSARDPQAAVECVDVLASSPGPSRAVYNWVYLFLVRYAGWLWKFGYALLDDPIVHQLIQPLRLRWNLWIARKFVAAVQSNPPDVVLVTHFLPADVLCEGRRAGWLASPLVVVITDMYPHRFWTVTGADAVAVSTAKTAEILRVRQADLISVHVTGIPVDPAFGRDADLFKVRAGLGLTPGRTTVLVTSGGTTVGQFGKVVGALMRLEAVLPGRLQLLVVCGNDEAAVRRLKQAAVSSTMPVQVLGFVDTMAELMAASDLIVCKAGGLTVSEALARNLPLILYHIIPGQEQLNAQHIADSGAGRIARNPAHAAGLVRGLVEQPQEMARMREVVQRIRRPAAADDVVTEVALPLVTRRGPMVG